MTDELSLLGIYYSVMSLILVYQIFLLQTWAANVNDTDAQVTRVKQRTTKGTREWNDALDSCKSLLKGFPKGIIVVIGIVLILLTVLSLIVATSVAFPIYLTYTPIIAFGVLGTTAPVYVRIVWGRKLDEDIKQLQ